MNRLQKYVIKTTVASILRLLAFTAQRNFLNWLTAIITSVLARLTILTKGIKKANNLDDLGKAWQKGFPSAKQVPITGSDSSHLYAEIHTNCPLRGTGNVDACHKMMAFDRAIVGAAGGRFSVLSSQAQAGNTICKVSMTLNDNQKI